MTYLFIVGHSASEPPLLGLRSRQQDLPPREITAGTLLVPHPLYLVRRNLEPQRTAFPLNHILLSHYDAGTIRVVSSQHLILFPYVTYCVLSSACLHAVRS